MIPSSSPPSRSLGIATRTILCAAVLCGCEREVPASFPTRSSSAEEQPRRPAGIAVDLRSTPPPARDRASTDEPSVALRAPLGVGQAHAVVNGFFDAVYGEDISALGDLLVEDAVVQDTRPRSKTKSHGAAALWRQRFQKRAYQSLVGQLVYRPTDIATFRDDQLDALPLGVRYLTLNEAVRPGDIVLHVPIVTHSIKSERLFGNHVFFWLRRRGSRYVIYQMAEDVPL
jgi:hypothetical protein